MAKPERLYINRYPACTPRAYQPISDLGIKVGSSNYQPDNGRADPVSSNPCSCPLPVEGHSIAQSAEAR